MNIETIQKMHEIEAKHAVDDLEKWFKDQIQRLERTKYDLENYLVGALEQTSYHEMANRMTWAVNLLQQQVRDLDGAARTVGKLERVAATQELLENLEE